jgi:hypothetical protein
MDRFGGIWRNHAEKLSENWNRIVTDDDTVLLPGDLSWAIRWQEFLFDLNYLSSLKGSKVISRGNHDFYWSSKTKMQLLLPMGIEAINQSFVIREGFCIAAIKGWLTPKNPAYKSEEDSKYYLRERNRLLFTLKLARKTGLPLIVQMHFPPFYNYSEVGFSDILEEYSVQLCIYGHLHSGNWVDLTYGIKGGVTYQLVSADYLRFTPKKVI